MAEPIPGRSWLGSETRGHAIRRRLLVDPFGTIGGDQYVVLSILDTHGDGTGVMLDPGQLREIAADLTARADLIEGGGNGG